MRRGFRRTAFEKKKGTLQNRAVAPEARNMYRLLFDVFDSYVASAIGASITMMTGTSFDEALADYLEELFWNGHPVHFATAVLRLCASL